MARHPLGLIMQALAEYAFLGEDVQNREHHRGDGADHGVLEAIGALGRGLSDHDLRLRHQLPLQKTPLYHSTDPAATPSWREKLRRDAPACPWLGGTP